MGLSYLFQPWKRRPLPREVSLISCFETLLVKASALQESLHHPRKESSLSGAGIASLYSVLSRQRRMCVHRLAGLNLLASYTLDPHHEYPRCWCSRPRDRTGTERALSATIYFWPAQRFHIIWVGVQNIEKCRQFEPCTNSRCDKGILVF